jgi:hypothetical protein
VLISETSSYRITPVIRPVVHSSHDRTDDRAGIFAVTPETTEPQNVEVTSVSYRGKRALRVVERDPAANAETMAIVRGVKFRNGEIEADIAGMPGPGANEGARGFVGIAFRGQSAERYECFYLRPTNGRAMDQLRRNHSTQYISHPEYTWDRLRRERPGMYESYVDLVSGEWTHVRIVVTGTKAQRYVNHSPQPVLIVNDLKHGDTEGGVALWIGNGTIAHFANVKVK